MFCYVGFRAVVYRQGAKNPNADRRTPLTCKEHLFLWLILLMEEILHHLGCIKPCKNWDKLPTSTGCAGFLPSTVSLAYISFKISYARCFYYHPPITSWASRMPHFCPHYFFGVKWGSNEDLIHILLLTIEKDSWIEFANQQKQIWITCVNKLHKLPPPWIFEASGYPPKVTSHLINFQLLPRSLPSPKLT